MKSRYGMAPELFNHKTSHPSELRRKAFPIVGQMIGGLVFVLAVVIGTEKPAYAYTDPGSASLLWQIAVSSLIGVGYYFRKFIIRLFGKSENANKQGGVGGE